MDPSHRITKDTSARKNTGIPGIHSAIESAAVIASREAYINSIIQGYQEKIASIESEQQSAVNEAVQKAQTAAAHQIQKLEETIGELKRTLSGSQQETRTVRAEMEEKKGVYVRKTTRLEEKLKVGPNSWVEFHVTGKGRKKRTYVRRPSTPFTEALKDLAKDLGKDIDYMRFKFGEVEIRGKETRTLQQLGIKDGNTIDIL